MTSIAKSDLTNAIAEKTAATRVAKNAKRYVKAVVMVKTAVTGAMA
jgi:hypothetical protein